MELRVTGDKADMIICSLGLNYSYRVEAHGFIRGIWLLWNDLIRVDILVNNVQFVHTRIHYNDSDLGILFTAMYGSPQVQKRCYLWTHLTQLSSTVYEPWSITGTFNAMIDGYDRQGGATRGSGGCLFFS